MGSLRNPGVLVGGECQDGIGASPQTAALKVDGHQHSPSKPRVHVILEYVHLCLVRVD